MTQNYLSEERFQALENKPVLVTGGAGFIGSHLVDALVDLGAEVTILDDLSTGYFENIQHLEGKIRFIKGDIRSFETCMNAVHGNSIIFHQAALGSVPRSMENPQTSMEVNVQGTVNIFTSSVRHKVERLVFASSSSVYGDSRKLPKIEGEEGTPLSPYAMTKSMNEDIADIFRLCYGLQSIGLRYFNVFGPRQSPSGPYAAVIPLFMQAALTGNRPIIFGDGEQSRDFTFVLDAVRANLLAATADESANGQFFNVAGGNQTTINELAQKILILTGSDQTPDYQPSRPGDVEHSLADLTHSLIKLQYKPETAIDDGLEITIQSFS